MKRLLTLDQKDYTDDMPVFEKVVVRALIAREGRLAMQESGTGEYKIPGGGVEPGESLLAALGREVQEETGLVIRPESVRELGEILELREDILCQGQKYVCRTLFYQCEAEEEIRETAMTESELRLGFHLAWARPDAIVARNTALQTESWKQRDTEFLKLVLAGEVELTGSGGTQAGGGEGFPCA